MVAPDEEYGYCSMISRRQSSTASGGCGVNAPFVVLAALIRGDFLPARPRRPLSNSRQSRQLRRPLTPFLRREFRHRDHRLISILRRSSFPSRSPCRRCHGDGRFFSLGTLLGARPPSSGPPPGRAAIFLIARTDTRRFPCAGRPGGSFTNGRGFSQGGSIISGIYGWSRSLPFSCQSQPPLSPA